MSGVISAFLNSFCMRLSFPILYRCMSAEESSTVILRLNIFLQFFKRVSYVKPCFRGKVKHLCVGSAAECRYFSYGCFAFFEHLYRFLYLPVPDCFCHQFPDYLSSFCFFFFFYFL